jgi:hypothetical protein
LGSLQDQALLLLAATFPGEQGGARGVLEHLSDALVCLGGALEVLGCADLLADILGLAFTVSISLLLSFRTLLCAWS